MPKVFRSSAEAQGATSGAQKLIEVLSMWEFPRIVIGDPGIAP